MSLKAIAKQLGISVTTVSRALNGYDDVSQETRARVEAEAQRRGYRPNTFARRLKMGTIDAVGLVFPVRPAPLNNNVFLEMVGEISHELARHDIDLLLIADDEQADKHGYMRMVQGRRVDALIVAHTLDDDPRLAQLQASGFPFLALGRSRLAQPYAWFDFDNYAGTCRATRHLIQQGHQRIALLGENNNQAFILQRRNGYLDALREAGLSDAWLRSVPATRRGGYQATLELLRLPEPPTAIITDCNTHGDGAAMALAHLGRLTGDNRVALVVYDGLPQDSIIETDVAAVIQSTRQGVGRQIADMVRRLIAGEDLATLELLRLPEPPTAIITDCNTHGDGAAMALAHLGRLTGDNRVALVVYDGLPQDSIIETDVAAVIQSTRQGVGRQIADMVRRLIAGEDLATLQVLWQPEFIPGETA
ncbi:substrate-binding domain-containing protein [Klebsiella pneumoniae]